MASWLGEQFKGMDFKSFSFGTMVSALIIVGIFGIQHTLLGEKVADLQADVDKFTALTISRTEFDSLKAQVNRIEDKLDRLLER